MKYIIVNVALSNEGHQLFANFIELDRLTSFMWGREVNDWMLIQIDPNTGAKKHIQWPEQFGGEASTLTELLRTAIYS